MSILGFLHKWVSGNNDTDVGKRRLIVDGLSLVSPGNGEMVRPPDQLQILERYGDFCQREKISLTVFFVGKKLRELDENGRYGEVAVVYEENREKMPSRLKEVLRSEKRAGTVVVTRSPEMEQTARLMGASVMRDTTLRKALERSSGERKQGGGKPSRNRGAGGGNNAARKNVSPRSDKAGGNNPKRESGNSSDGIDDLIDRV